MATDPRVQYHVECTECDRNAEYYCNTCTDSLCTRCKQKHESKIHDVVICREKTTEFCNIHSGLPYIWCCQKCEVPVCQKCIDENHRKHSFVFIDDVFESKKEEYCSYISKIKVELLPISASLLKDIQSDSLRCKEEITKIQSAMTSKAQVLKDIIDAILAENMEFLKGLENSLICELQQEEEIMNSHIAYLKNILDEYYKYISTKQHAGFIKFQNDNPISKVKETPKLTEINLPSFPDVKVKKEDIVRLLGRVNESTKSKKVRNIQAVNKSEASMKLIPSATKRMSFTAPEIVYSRHISPVTADQAWVGDDRGKLVLTDIKGEKLDEMEYIYGKLGCHSMFDTEELIFLKEGNGIYKATADDKKPTLIKNVPQRFVSSIYSSPSNGDILVGTFYRVIRYKKTGKEVHQIRYDNKGHPLFGCPIYITENHMNGDVCVSDRDKFAVVVVDKNRNHRFSYTGHPPGSALRPRGICTDTQGHILVSDKKSHTIQMTDKDGHFLSFLLTTREGIKNPVGLSLDVRNNLLWVGQTNEVSVYKYKPQ